MNKQIFIIILLCGSVSALVTIPLQHTNTGGNIGGNTTVIVNNNINLSVINPCLYLNGINSLGLNLTCLDVEYPHIGTTANLTINASNILNTEWLIMTPAQLNATISSFITNNAYQINASSIVAVVGVSQTGLLTNTYVEDSLYYNLSKNNPNGIDLRLNYTLNTGQTFSEIRGHLYYPTSSVSLYLWDYDSNNWELYYDFGGSTGFIDYDINVPDPQNHISNGITQVRIYGTTTGSQIFSIDKLVLFNGQSGAVNLAHDSTTGRENYATNHKVYADAIDSVNDTAILANTTANNALPITGGILSGDVVGPRYNVTTEINVNSNTGAINFNSTTVGIYRNTTAIWIQFV